MSLRRADLRDRWCRAAVLSDPSTTIVFDAEQHRDRVREYTRAHRVRSGCADCAAAATRLYVVTVRRTSLQVMAHECAGAVAGQMLPFRQIRVRRVEEKWRSVQ